MSESSAEAGPPIAVPPREWAPSRLAAESGGLPRTLGVLGLAGMFAATMTVLANQTLGPRWFNTQYSVVLLAVSLALALYGALRENDSTVLRGYGSFGFGLILISGILTLANSNNFPLYGWPGLLIGLSFLICHARREEDAKYRATVLASMLGLGVLFMGFGMICGAIWPEFLLRFGVILSILGLLYLSAYLGQVGTYTGAGYTVAKAVGLIGLGFAAFGLVRSVLPNVGVASLSPYAVPQGIFLIAFGLLYAAVGIGGYTDNTVVVLARRELSAYFYSPIAYLTFFVLVFVGAINFYMYYQNFFAEGRMGTLMIAVPEPIVGRYLMSFVVAVVIVVLVPGVTMRLFSEEKQSGSYEVLMAAPVTELAVVLSKFFAGLVFFVILWIPLALYLLPLRIALGQPFDYRPIVSFFLALTSVGAAFVAMGLFFSSLTKNQIVALVLTFGGMLFFLMIVILVDFARLPETARRVFSKLSFWTVLANSIQGRLYLRDFVNFGSLTIFWLYLTVKSVESRKWS